MLNEPTNSTSKFLNFKMYVLNVHFTILILRINNILPVTGKCHYVPDSLPSMHTILSIHPMKAAPMNKSETHTCTIFYAQL